MRKLKNLCVLCGKSFYRQIVMEDQKLEAYFKFDEADLETNRQGRFSEKQQARLIENDRKIQRKWGWRSIPLFLVAGVGPIMAISSGDFFGWGWKISWGLVWTGLWGGIALIMLLSFLSKPKKLVFAKTTGKVNIGTDAHTRSTSLRLHIGRHGFDIEEDILDAMTQGAEYTIYYEKDWDEIVSAELVNLNSK